VLDDISQHVSEAPEHVGTDRLALEAASRGAHRPAFVAETQKWFDQNCTSLSTYPVSAAAAFLKRTSASARKSCCGTGCSALAFTSDVVLPCATSRGAAGLDVEGSGLAGAGGTSSRPPVASGWVGSFWRIAWIRWRSANRGLQRVARGGQGRFVGERDLRLVQLDLEQAARISRRGVEIGAGAAGAIAEAVQRE
jgi:hypothetical protein